MSINENPFWFAIANEYKLPEGEAKELLNDNGISILSDEPVDPKTRISSQINSQASTIIERLRYLPRVVPDFIEKEAKSAGPDVNNLAKRILFLDKRRKQTQSNIRLTNNFTIAIYGPWGTGKTSLLRAIEHFVKRDHLSYQQGDDPVRNQQFKGNAITVWFEPWRYENEKHLILPLLSEMQTTIAENLRLENYKAAALETGKKLLGRMGRDALRASSKIVEKHTGIDFYQLGEEFFKNYAEVQSDWSNAQSEVEGFKADFQKLLLIAHADTQESPSIGGRSDRANLSYSPVPVFVFIDDLDRCSPEQVRRLLESIKVFLHVPGVVYFLALDEEQVLRAMSEPYLKFVDKDTGLMEHGEIRSLARRYLEKFFQHTVNVESVNSLSGSNQEELLHSCWYGLCQNFHDACNRANIESYCIEGTKSRRLHLCLRAIFWSCKRVPRAIKISGRWIYFRYQPELLRLIHTGDDEDACSLISEFAESVFSLNFGKLWTIQFIDLSAEGKNELYQAAALLFCDAIRPDIGNIQENQQPDWEGFRGRLRTFFLSYREYKDNISDRSITDFSKEQLPDLEGPMRIIALTEESLEAGEHLLEQINKLIINGELTALKDLFVLLLLMDPNLVRFALNQPTPTQIETRDNLILRLSQQKLQHI